jgi:hypothetical protein
MTIEFDPFVTEGRHDPLARGFLVRGCKVLERVAA